MTNTTTNKTKKCAKCGKPIAPQYTYCFRCNERSKQASFSAPLSGANTSARYPNGRTLSTRDEHLPQELSKVKELKDKRWVAVVDSNADDQLAVVPLTTQNHSNTTPLYGYKTGNNKNTYFRHFVEIEDSQGSPITVDGDKFKENNPEYDLSEQNLRQVRDKVFTKSKQASRNRSKLEILKSWFSRKK